MLSTVVHSSIQFESRENVGYVSCEYTTLILIVLIFVVIGGLEEVVRIGKVVTDPVLLRALCKIIVTMVPTPDEILVCCVTMDRLHVLPCHVRDYTRMATNL